MADGVEVVLREENTPSPAHHGLLAPQRDLLLLALQGEVLPLLLVHLTVEAVRPVLPLPVFVFFPRVFPLPRPLPLTEVGGVSSLRELRQLCRPGLRLADFDLPGPLRAEAGLDIFGFAKTPQQFGCRLESAGFSPLHRASLFPLQRERLVLAVAAGTVRGERCLCLLLRLKEKY